MNLDDSTDTVSQGKGGGKREKVITHEGEFTDPSQVQWVSSDTAPGLYVSYGSEDEVHAAMQHPGVLPDGLLLGANPAQSLQNLQNWSISLI